LSVNHLLEGSVRKAGKRVRVTAQLIDASDGSHVWSDVYERDLQDIFAVQEEIARSVASALRINLGNQSGMKGGTQNVAAFDEFLIGRGLMSSNAPIDVSRPHLEKAVALDPAYLEAWIWLIDNYTRGEVADSEHRAALRTAQQKAIDTVTAAMPNSDYAAV